MDKQERKDEPAKRWEVPKDVYLVSKSLIIQKIFQIAPWKGPGLQFHWGRLKVKGWILKLGYHFCLLVLSTLLICLVNWQWAGYQRAASAISCKYFLPNQNLCAFDDCIGHLTTVHPSVSVYGCTLFQRRDVEVAIVGAVEAYYSMNRSSLAGFQFPFQNEAGNAFHNCQPNDDIPEPQMTITYVDSTFVDGLFPKNSPEEEIAEIRALLSPQNINRVTAIELTLPLFDTFYTDIYHASYLWQYQINFDKDAGISSFEVSSKQQITHICGIESHDAASTVSHRDSQSEGIVYSYEYAIQVTAILTIVVSLLYLLSLLVDLVDNLRLTYFVSDLLREAQDQLSQLDGTSAPAAKVAFTEETSITRNLRRMRLCLVTLDRWMRWLLHIPTLDRLRYDHLTKRWIHNQHLPSKPLDNNSATTQTSPNANLSTNNDIDTEAAILSSASTTHLDSPTKKSRDILAPAALYRAIEEDEDDNDKEESLNTDADASTGLRQRRPNTTTNGAPVGDETGSESNECVSHHRARDAETVVDPEKKTVVEADVVSEKDRRRRAVQHWEHLSYRVKMRLLDGWRLLSTLGALLSLSAACIFTRIPQGFYAVYFPGALGSDSPRLMLGLSTAVQYLTLLGYLRYSNRFTASALVLWGAFFKVQRIFVSIFPLAVGLALLGILIFGFTAETFGDFDAMAITLFSVMNCDSIWQTFQDTTAFSNVTIVGTLYVTVIFVVFNYLLLRLVLAVVESLYYYLRLYTHARRKRMLFRTQLLREGGPEEVQGYAQASGMRLHTSQDIQLSLFKVYAQQLHQQRQGSPQTPPLEHPDHEPPQPTSQPTVETNERRKGSVSSQGSRLSRSSLAGVVADGAAGILMSPSTSPPSSSPAATQPVYPRSHPSLASEDNL